MSATNQRPTIAETPVTRRPPEEKQLSARIPSTTKGTEFVELDPVECLRLLAGAEVGRVIFTINALPTAEPVNFVLDVRDDLAEDISDVAYNEEGFPASEVVFRTGGGGKFAAAVRNAVVAFQVDDIDFVRHTGWSVVGIGAAYEVRDPKRLAALEERLKPWMPHLMSHTIAIPLRRLTGRRLSGGSPEPAGPASGPLTS